ncbi:DUF2339 domain-containing protein [Kordiimonas sp. SCSIO 12610]|uniref:DUF2339 domain-containing protein n=1 Tax=Kordiimonas sp. SCSIO 12610 TaxID=2829597 RepID=UPI00210E1F8A|nr:DUF2339 domain-containing protein [Kordiimonas sp. SCSIO 12610]UTW54801.1 DUF2339 domain-containing protein [Kordiimonas sp. SCSIO 12610]
MTHNAKPASGEQVENKLNENSSRKTNSLEGDMSSKWMIWIGGVVLALGGVFLVKYSIDEGLLHPAIRVALGAILGIFLVGSGEWVRRKQSSVSWLKDRPSYVPGAVAAAGLLIIFAAVYSAYSLYELIPFWLTFISLACVSLMSSWLARVHGKYFAYLGLIAGMAVPALVSSNVPSAWGLFPYLIAIISASLWGARHNRWTDITVTSLLMASLWVVGWIMTNWHTGDMLPVGLFVLSLASVNQWMLRGASDQRVLDETIIGLRAGSVITIISDAMMVFCTILIIAMVRLEHYSLLSLIIAGIGFVGMFAAASPIFKKDHGGAEYDAGLIVALIGSLFLLATWHTPGITDLASYIGETPVNAFARLPVQAPGFEIFLSVSIFVAAFVGGSTYVCLKRVLRKSMWSIIGTAYPILVLAIDFWRLDGYANNIPFVSVTFTLAGFFAFCAYQLYRRQNGDWALPLSAYLAGATTAISLALAMVLKDAWLSFALALEVFALAYIWQKTSVEGLRKLAVILALVVLVRLFLNVAIFDYGGGVALPIINWIWYSYGLGSVLFLISAKLFDRGDNSETLISVLKAGSALLACGFVTFELRILLSSDNTLLGSMTAFETALQTINWTILGLIIYWRAKRDYNDLLMSLSHVISFAGVVALVFGGGVFNNILFKEINVGSLPVFNLQFIQFLIPGLLYGFKALLAKEPYEKWIRLSSGIVSLGAVFLWLTLEIRHIFYPMGGSGAVSEWEWYGYSAVWLAYAFFLLLVGVKINIQGIRKAGMAMLALVVLKVFLLDLNHLEGIARALSFIGLGITLIAMGYLYQYFRHQQKQRIEHTREGDDLNLYSMD